MFDGKLVSKETMAMVHQDLNELAVSNSEMTDLRVEFDTKKMKNEKVLTIPGSNETMNLKDREMRKRFL